MIRPFAAQLRHLDSVYGDQPYFVGVKARLLAAFDLLALAFVPVNIATLFLLHVPDIPVRIVLNLAIFATALLSLRWVWQGRLTFAGNAMALGLILPTHALVFLAGSFPQPLSAAIQLLAFDLVFLLVAIVFASRRVAMAVLVIIVAANLGIHALAFQQEFIPGTLKFAADTLLRDALFALGFVFCLGLAVLHMVETAHLRHKVCL